MTPSQQLQEIKEAVVAANPEIMELKFGCEIILGISATLIVIDTYNGFKTISAVNGLTQNWTIEERVNMKILGRKIGIADVLLAINYSEKGLGYNATTLSKSKNTTIIDCDTNIGASDRPTMTSYRIGNFVWNLLKDDLSLQDPATISFIHSLISKK